MKIPCYKCEDRVAPTKDSFGCKSYCTKWEKYRIEKDIEIAIKNENKIAGSDYYCYTRDKKRRLKRETNTNIYGK